MPWELCLTLPFHTSDLAYNEHSFSFRAAFTALHSIITSTVVMCTKIWAIIVYYAMKIQETSSEIAIIKMLTLTSHSKYS